MSAIIDANWCIDNIELAAEYFNEKQSENFSMENNLNILRKYKKEELDELYWQIRGLIMQFNNNYSDMISIKNGLSRLQTEEVKGISETLILEKDRFRNKLKLTFQNLIDSHEKIRNRITTLSFDQEIYKLNVSAQKLYDEGDYSQAVERWNSILAMDPRNLVALDGIEKTKNKFASNSVKNFCPKCGNPNKRRLKYCTHCGTSLIDI